MRLKPMHAGHSTVLIGHRYLERGFLDVAMRLFVRHAALVEKRDWALLVERLMDRHRIVDAIRVCEIGGVPVPRAQLLALGDGSLQRKNFEAAIRLYELGDADRERWARVVDLLSARPDQERRAIALAERYLVSEVPEVELRLAAANQCPFAPGDSGRLLVVACAVRAGVDRLLTLDHADFRALVQDGLVVDCPVH